MFPVSFLILVFGCCSLGYLSGRLLKLPHGDAKCANEVFLFSFQIGWLNAIREWQEEFVGNMSSREFVDTVTRDLLGSRVFVFTPRGEVRSPTDYYVKIALLEALNLVLLLHRLKICLKVQLLLTMHI